MTRFKKSYLPHLKSVLYTSDSNDKVASVVIDGRFMKYEHLSNTNTITTYIITLNYMIFLNY